MASTEPRKHQNEKKLAPQPRALSITHFCKVFDTSRSSVWRGLKAGRLRSIAIGKKRLILLDDLAEREIGHEMKAATALLEALVFDVRGRGFDALRDPTNSVRVSLLSDQQLTEVSGRLLKKCPAKPSGVALSDVIAVRELH